ncbi:MAG: radical SAM protein, partial [Eubacterium sp.]
HVVVETCGYSPFFKEALPYIDLLYFDVKHPDACRHLEMTGKDNQLILENLKYAVNQGKEMVVRIPVIPEFNDRREDWSSYGALLKRTGVTKAHLLPFHQLGLGKYRNMDREYEYEEYPSMEKDSLDQMKEELEGMGIGTQIGG